MKFDYFWHYFGQTWRGMAPLGPHRQKKSFLFFLTFLIVPSLHNSSFGIITGSRDPSRIVDLAEMFILVYSLSMLAHWDACSGLDKAICALATQHMCSGNTAYVLLQPTIFALATHRMFSWMTPYGSMELERFWLDPPLFSDYNEKMHFGMASYLYQKMVRLNGLKTKSIKQVAKSNVKTLKNQKMSW